MTSDLAIEAFALRLSGRMERQRCTSAELAGITGIANRRIQRLALGHLAHGPTIHEAARLSQALRCSKLWLAFGEGAP